MPSRIVLSEPWAALWMNGGARCPPRTYVAFLRLTEARSPPLGTVVAPTAAAAYHVARWRWPGAARALILQTAAAARVDDLVVALSLDGGA